jgi:amino-acid N-acetyltransferase
MPTVRIGLADTDLRSSAAVLVAGAGLPTVGLDQAWRVLVSTDQDGAVEGVVALERHRDGAGAAYLLRSLAVRSDGRGHGLGAELVDAAIAVADTDHGGIAAIGLLTETAVGYFERFGFRPVARDHLAAGLAASPELTGVCGETAQAYLRP